MSYSFNMEQNNHHPWAAIMSYSFNMAQNNHHPSAASSSTLTLPLPVVPWTTQQLLFAGPAGRFFITNNMAENNHQAASSSTVTPPRPVVPWTTQQLLFADPAANNMAENNHQAAQQLLFAGLARPMPLELGHIHPCSLAKFLGPPEYVPNDFLSLGSIPGVLMSWYEDSPKIIKRLTHTDVGTNHSLILPKEDVESQFLCLMDQAMAEQCRSPHGVRFLVLDADDSSSHELVLKKHASSGSHVLIGNWKRSFVDRKNLRAGDDVGVAFDHGSLIFKLVNKNN